MLNMMNIIRKEFNGFFASPAAFLFIGAFLAVTLFVFFWGEGFFARNLADVRPLFRWMPLLLIFLVAALTMRSWSEELRAGTLETLLTSPVKPIHLVLGKFIATLALVALSLLLTISLPVTVSFLGTMDWGPVVGGYLAAMFLAASYVAIGMYMSSRTDNSIVALILTTLTCAALYLLGSSTITSLFGYETGNLLAKLGSGSRFQSITRGVLDLRDLYYYLSIVGIFLVLNLYGLEKLRWVGNPTNARHSRWKKLVVLVVANFVIANFWLGLIGWLRYDMTAGQRYSLSDATQQYINQLQEPLLIRGYFSAQTHELLAPLVPEIRDLLEEYAVAGNGKIQVEFADPHKNQRVEEEAASRFGVRSIPFRVDSKYQSGVVNSYFHLVVSYADQYETLSIEDLIEVRVENDDELQVALKNPEYEITRSIRKSLTSYQGSTNPFDTLTDSVTFHGYLSPDEMIPPELVEVRKQLDRVLDELKQQAGDRLEVVFTDPEANGGEVARQLEEDYGFGPQIASLLDPRPFWFYMVLESEKETVQIPLPESLTEDEMKRSINSALQRLAPGFLKTVAMVIPELPNDDPMKKLGPPPNSKLYNNLQDILAKNVRINKIDIRNGRIPTDVDLLLIMAPKWFDDKQLYAVDQFLMQGGSIILATSPYDVVISNSITANPHDSGMREWLQHYGIEFEDAMVLDSQSAPLPLPSRRRLGSITVNEIQLVPYPYFPDIRDSGLNKDSVITSGLAQLSMAWASSIKVDMDKNKSRRVTKLVNSSPTSWSSDSLELLPDFRQHPELGFLPADKTNSFTLAVLVEGRFDSWYKNKESPFMKKQQDDTEVDTANETSNTQIGDKKEIDQLDSSTDLTSRVIERSPDSARILLIATNSFADDAVLQLASQGAGRHYSKPVELLQNAIDYSLEDSGLLSIRGRTGFARTLEPLTSAGQLLWESLNYIFILFGLLVVWLWRRYLRAVNERHYQAILKEV